MIQSAGWSGPLKVRKFLRGNGKMDFGVAVLTNGVAEARVWRQAQDRKAFRLYIRKIPVGTIIRIAPAVSAPFSEIG